MLICSRILLLGLTFFITTPTILFADVNLKFGLYPSDRVSSMVKQFRPILSDIERKMTKRLSEPVHIQINAAMSYEDGIYDLAQGRVDFARLGPVSYVKAKIINTELKILALESINNKKNFNGVICVNKNSKLFSVDDLKNKRFAFGNERSTIGRYLSQLFLLNNNIKASDLAAYEYHDRHDIVGTAVAIGKFDAGALKENTFNKLVKKGAPIRLLTTFRNVTKPWVTKSGLPFDIYTALKESLLSMNNSESLKIIKKDGFLPGNDNDFTIIRKAIDINPQFFIP